MTKTQGTEGILRLVATYEDCVQLEMRRHILLGQKTKTNPNTTNQLGAETSIRKVDDAYLFFVCRMAFNDAVPLQALKVVRPHRARHLNISVSISVL